MTDSDETPGVARAEEGQTASSQESGAAEVRIGAGGGDQPEPVPTASEPAPQEPRRKGHRGYSLLAFVLGLVLGALGAILGPRYAQPYLENLGPFSHSAPASGRVVEKRLEEDRLLLRVSTDEGLTLAIFTRNLEDVDLLIGQGDSVELGAGRYEPFLHDPAILRVRPAKATIRNDSQRRSADIGSQIGTDDRAGAEPGPRAAGEARMEYEHRMERQLTQLEALIATFERRVTRAGTDIGEATRHELDELNERRGAARAKLKEIKTATAYAWQDLRAGVDEAWENLREALIDAQARFGEGERVPPSTVPTPAPAGPSDGAQDRDPSR